MHTKPQGAAASAGRCESRSESAGSLPARILFLVIIISMIMMVPRWLSHVPVTPEPQPATTHRNHVTVLWEVSPHLALQLAACAKCKQQVPC